MRLWLRAPCYDADGESDISCAQLTAAAEARAAAPPGRAALVAADGSTSAHRPVAARQLRRLLAPAPAERSDISQQQGSDAQGRGKVRDTTSTGLKEEKKLTAVQRGAALVLHCEAMM